MAAEAVSSQPATPQATPELSPEHTPQGEVAAIGGHAGPAGPSGPVTLDGILAATGPDPSSIAKTMVARGKTTDPRLWTEIHQRLGNTMAVQIKSAIDSDASVGPIDNPDADLTPAGADKAPEPIASVPDTGEVLTQPYLNDVLGVELVAPAGVRTAAVQDCVGFIQAEVSKNEYAQAHFAKAKVQIVIIPAHVPMTDVDQFKDLKGKKTFDGRDWETVRGSGGTQTHDGHYAVAIAEESIVSVKDALSNYPATYSVGMHELAHVLEEKGMTDEQQARVKELYANHLKADPDDAKDTFTDEYASKTEREYWANSTNAFFGRNQMGKNHSGRQWLQDNDPDMYAFCVEIYETARDKKGKPAT